MSFHNSLWNDVSDYIEVIVKAFADIYEYRSVLFVHIWFEENISWKQEIGKIEDLLSKLTFDEI